MQTVRNIKLIFKLIALFIQVACLQSCKVPGETYTIFRTKNSCLTIGQTKHPCLEARKLCLYLGGELADFNESLTILKNWTNVEYWIANHSQVTDATRNTDDKAFQVVAIVFGCLLSISFVMNIILYQYRKTYILKYQEETFQTSRNDNSSVNVVAVSPDDNYGVCTSDESSSGQTQRRVIDVVDCGNYSEVKDEELACHDIANGHRVGVGSVNPADQATLYTILDHKGSHLVLKDPSHVYGLNSGSAPSLERPHDNYEVCASDESYSIKFQRRVSEVVDSGNYSEAKEVGLVERGISNGQELCGGESSDNLSQTGTYTALNHKGSHLALNDPSHVYGLNSGGTQSSFDELSNNQ